MFDFTVVVVSDAFASAVALTLDILAAAKAMAQRVGAPVPRWQVRSVVAGQTRLSNDLLIDAIPLDNKSKRDTSTWIIPGLATPTVSLLDARLSKPDAQLAAKALKAHADAGGAIAASCSAVFLLQAAGLLKNRKVTTTWWLAAYLQNVEPECVVDANRMVISDGNIWTAGAALAQTDLMLQLIQARFGAALADAISKVLLIDTRSVQSPFIVPAMLANGDDFIARLSDKIQATLPQTPNVAALATQLCISERTLARRVHAMSGQSTSALIQFVRLQRARALLETSRMSVEQVAEQVGYSDSTALRRLMRKIFNATPRQFRPSMRAG